MTDIEEGQVVATATTEVPVARRERAPRHRGKGHMEGLYPDRCEQCLQIRIAADEGFVVDKPIKVVPSLWASAMELANGDKRKIKILAHNRLLVG